MASDYPFANPLPKVSGHPDVTFSCVPGPSATGGLQKLVCASESKTDDGEILFTVHTTDEGHTIHYAKMVDFSLSPDAITAHLLDPAYAYMVEILLVGEIFSLWLELKGMPMIHASAAVVDDTALAFLSSNKGGKTGLAAALTQKGYPILTDDILPLEEDNSRFLARPGFPAMRMWPDEAGYFLGEYEHLDLVNPNLSKRRIPVGCGGLGTFCDEKKPLKVIYLPQRQDADSDITIEPLSQKTAFFALIRNSFLGGLAEILGPHQERMNFFSRMVRQVPVRQLKYPSGFDHLPRVVDAVLEDSASL